MNKVVLMGRLTRDPEVRYTQSDKPMAIARYSLAVQRIFGRKDEEQADFINCVVFNKGAEFAEKYLKQGTKIVVSGRIQTGSYVNKDGVKIYTTDVIIDEQEFAESKSASENNNSDDAPKSRNISEDVGFMNVPDGIDEELPWN